MSAAKKKAPFGKWIDGVEPEQPAWRVAKRVLTGRIQVVLHWMRLTDKHWKQDTEYVHQLRVATRRAAVALQIFGDFLPRKKANLLKRWLTRLRRSAGRARDLDVLILGLAEQDSIASASPRQTTQLLKFLRRLRREAQEDLQRMTSKSSRRAAAQLGKSIRWRAADKTLTFSQVARSVLRPIMEEFFQAAAGDWVSIAAIHQLRIKGKKARYAFETLAAAFPKSFRSEVYESLCDVQQDLGRINDLATAIDLYENWLCQAKPLLASSLAGYRDHAASELERHCQEFRAAWQPQAIEALQARSAKFLTSPASG
jgi:CHAD domain-containing protein